MKKQLLTITFYIFSFTLYAQIYATPELEAEIKIDSVKNFGRIQTSPSQMLLVGNPEQTGEDGTVNEDNKLTQPVENNIENTNTPQKLAEHAPDSNDPDYAAKKEEWIKNYPDEYRNMVRSSTPLSKQVFDRKEFNSLPLEKQNTIMAHPDLYEISNE